MDQRVRRHDPVAGVVPARVMRTPVPVARRQLKLLPRRSCTLPQSLCPTCSRVQLAVTAPR